MREGVVLRLPLSVPHVDREPRDVDHVEGKFEGERLGAWQQAPGGGRRPDGCDRSGCRSAGSLRSRRRTAAGTGCPVSRGTRPALRGRHGDRAEEHDHGPGAGAVLVEADEIAGRIGQREVRQRVADLGARGVAVREAEPAGMPERCGGVEAEFVAFDSHGGGRVAEVFCQALVRAFAILPRHGRRAPPRAPRPPFTGRKPLHVRQPE